MLGKRRAYTISLFGHTTIVLGPGSNGNGSIYKGGGVIEGIDIKELHRRWKAGLEVPPKKLPFLDFPEESCPLIEGFSHIIAGKPKVGKTELLLQVVMGWSDKKVAWLTEEPRQAWVSRVAKMDEFFENAVGTFTLFTKVRADEPDAILRDVKRMGADVVVIDTVKLLKIRDENDNGGINRALTPWTAWAEESGATPIFMHHNRNADGSFGDEIAGGHAWVGIVDVFLSVKRRSSKKDDTRRVVEGIGRVDEVKPFVYTLDPTTKKIEILGPLSTNSLDEVKVRVLEVIRNAPDPARGMLTAEVRNQLTKPQPAKRQVQDALTELVEEGGHGVLRVPPLDETAAGKRVVWRVTAGPSEPEPETK